MSQGFREHVGMKIEPVGEGRTHVTLQVQDQHLNPHGKVHGGVLATLADVAGAEAVAAGSESGPGITIELKITYLNPGEPGVLVADARVIKRGRRITIVETEVFQEDELVAHAIGTFAPTG